MEYAKRAALAVLRQLGPRDLVGRSPSTRSRTSSDRSSASRTAGARSRRASGALQYGGGTDFKDALDVAARNLLAAGPRVRHIILITDGDTNRRAEDHVDTIAGLAQHEITVTTIRIGSDTGESRAPRAHLARDRRRVPPRRGRAGAAPAHDQRRAAPDRCGGEPPPGGAARRRSRPILAGIDEEDLPSVSGWAVTRARPAAEVRLWVESGERRDPLLATWQYELGRVAAVPMDFQAGAASWPTWRGFAKLWSQLAMWAVPQGLAADRHVTARRVRDGALVGLATVDDEPGPFRLRVRDTGDDVVLHPVGRRRFAALVAGLGPGVHPAVLADGDARRTSTSSSRWMRRAAASSGRRDPTWRFSRASRR
jgi:hypothetical protein